MIRLQHVRSGGLCGSNFHVKWQTQYRCLKTSLTACNGEFAIPSSPLKKIVRIRPRTVESYEVCSLAKAQGSHSSSPLTRIIPQISPFRSLNFGNVYTSGIPRHQDTQPVRSRSTIASEHQIPGRTASSFCVLCAYPSRKQLKQQYCRQAYRPGAPDSAGIRPPTGDSGNHRDDFVKAAHRTSSRRHLEPSIAQPSYTLCISNERKKKPRACCAHKKGTSVSEI
jgi:hypothetical protein